MPTPSSPILRLPRACRWLAALILLAFAPLSPAATCTVTGGQIPFGLYNGFHDSSTTVISQLSVQCQSPTVLEALLGITLKVSLSGGLSASPLDRTLAMGGDRLHYNVYLQPNLTQILGDGTDGTVAPTSCFFSVLCGGQTSYTVTIYGAMPPHQDVSPGAYVDELTLTLAF